MAANTAARVERRSYLKSIGGLVGAGILAGCAGEDQPANEPGESKEDTDADADGEYEDFPETDVRMLIPYGTGGGYDQYTRRSAPYLEEYLPGDGAFVAQNMEGAGGRIAMEELYTADPDGTTIGILEEDLIPQQLLEEMNFDIAEMSIFGNFAVDINSIFVAEDAGLRTFDEFVTAVQDDNPPLCAVQSEAGAIFPAVLGELSGLYDADKVMDNLVIHDSRGDSIQTILRGDADYTAGSWPSLLPHHADNDGGLVSLIIGTTDEEPPEQLSDAETLGSLDISNGQGIMDMTIDGRTFGGPPDMPDELVQMYRDAFSDIANDDGFQAELEEIDRPLDFVDPETQQESIENRRELWEENRDLLSKLYE